MQKNNNQILGWNYNNLEITLIACTGLLNYVPFDLFTVTIQPAGHKYLFITPKESKISSPKGKPQVTEFSSSFTQPELHEGDAASPHPQDFPIQADDISL